ncbi:MAG: hypothetical protein UW65_C0004G0012 [candidate division WWE3 bacterium GW2011_GWB1_44_4]|uniref:Carbohydrate kinase PfkB domain-containing protein n=3 Tax=Katanobacteria TaxID=422282 RepID=A0A0G1KNC4_UNCKA|nr:MAG: hypothetical protein UW65_C0004G0012 [candidate division WWE3 bacterium GW2011_GWB1_44_4]KKT85156.1 MAG: hypothetical protein UW82_C0002G0026 [candidate division WWE3 bacterium GW2011_GWC2_44_9]OGC51871.1 MAG: hypothetical protein A2709_00740 [candidate division WWE3 bacterium RIFCSPHIGHO2_01_FULL_43_9]
MPFDVILISDVSIDEFLKVDDAAVMCDLDTHKCRICLNYAEKIPVAEFKTSLGGNAANVAVGLAKLGLNVSVYSEVGNDANGDRFVRELKERGVDNSLIIKTPGETDVHSIIVYQGERTILSYHRPKNYTVQKWEDPKWLYYSSLPKQFELFQQELVSYLKAHPNVLIAFNPGVYHFKAGYEKYKPFLQLTDLLFVNKEEAVEMLSQAGTKVAGMDTRALHGELYKLGPKMTVITDAANGASVSNGEEYLASPIFETKSPIVDKTGAGDAFASGFLAALLYGKTSTEALKWGVINSSMCIREVGPMNGLATKAGIEKLV